MLCAIHFLVYIVIYLITPFPLEWQLFFSLNRELLHLTPICGFVIGILLVNNKNLLLDFEENISLSKLVYLLTAIVVFFIIIDILFYEFISNMINSVYSFIFN